MYKLKMIHAIKDHQISRLLNLFITELVINTLNSLKKIDIALSERV